MELTVFNRDTVFVREEVNLFVVPGDGVRCTDHAKSGFFQRRPTVLEGLRTTHDPTCPIYDKEHVSLERLVTQRINM